MCLILRFVKMAWIIWKTYLLLRTAEEVEAQSYSALEKSSAVSTVHVILKQTAGNCHWLPITASVSFRF